MNVNKNLPRRQSAVPLMQTALVVAQNNQLFLYVTILDNNC